MDWDDLPAQPADMPKRVRPLKHPPPALGRFDAKVKWFFDTVGRKRVPWDQGHVEIVVRRANLLQVSVESHRGVSCCVVLCCAVLCCAVLCCAVLCCAVLCCAVLCCASEVYWTPNVWDAKLSVAT